MRYTFECNKCKAVSERTVSKALVEGDKVVLFCEGCQKEMEHTKVFTPTKIHGLFGDTSVYR